MMILGGAYDAYFNIILLVNKLLNGQLGWSVLSDFSLQMKEYFVLGMLGRRFLVRNEIRDRNIWRPCILSPSRTLKSVR
jgi:hypothetical protein